MGRRIGTDLQKSFLTWFAWISLKLESVSGQMNPFTPTLLRVISQSNQLTPFIVYCKDTQPIQLGDHLVAPNSRENSSIHVVIVFRSLLTNI